MGDTTFTPGPWCYTGDEDDDYVIWGPDLCGEPFVANIGLPFTTVGRSVAFNADVHDARLIAAAPDMYALLDTIIMPDGPVTSEMLFSAACRIAAEWPILRAKINGIEP